MDINHKNETLLSRTAYEKIENLLNQGELTPGSIVSQRQLVDLTGATLGSIRETIPRLEAEGLIKTIPKRGLMIPSIDVAFVCEAYELRKIIELHALRTAGVKLPVQLIQSWIAEHRAFLDSAPQDRDFSMTDEMQKNDWQLHAKIVAAAQNSLIDSIYRVNAIKIRMVVQSRIRITSNNAGRVLREHLAFLTALADGDIEAACIALEKHLNNSLALALGGSIQE